MNKIEEGTNDGPNDIPDDDIVSDDEDAPTE